MGKKQNAIQPSTYREFRSLAEEHLKNKRLSTQYSAFHPHQKIWSSLSMSFRFNRMLEFYVFDSGRGISVDKKEKIFDRFHQADISLTRAHEG